MAGACGLGHLNEDPDQKIILRNHTVLFLQNEKEQGALLGSGVIIPVRHAETVFDLTPEEMDATFALLKTRQGVDGRALSSRWVQRGVELLGGWRTDRYARPYACHAPVSAGTLCGTWHPVLAKATGKSVVVNAELIPCGRHGGTPSSGGPSGRSFGIQALAASWPGPDLAECRPSLA